MSNFEMKDIAMEMLMSGIVNQPGDSYSDVVMEYYQGKTKELLKCESYLQNIINDINSKRESITGKAIITKDNEWNKKVEDELAKFFNIKAVNIHWSSGKVNAYTLTPNVLIVSESKKAFEAGNYSNLKVHLCLYEELISEANLNSSELMAVILHEVGHNFYYCPIMAGLSIYISIITLGIPIIMSFLAKAIYHASWAIEDLIKKMIPSVYSAVNSFRSTLNDMTRFIAPIDTAIKVIKLLTNQAVIVARNPINGILKYGDEEGADSFAARFGYGPEQTSALRKMHTVENTVYGKTLKNGGTGMSLYHDLNQLSVDIIGMCALEPHPNNSQRASSMLKKLKRDLASGDYPQDMKKDLEKEIDRMEKMYNIAAKNSSSSNTQVRQAWFDTINTITKGNSDFREIFSFYFKQNQF